MLIEITFTTVLAALATSFGVYQAICWMLDRYNIGAKRKEWKLFKQASRDMMREIIRRTHHDAMRDAYIEDDELEHLEKVYETYHSLGGNGTADRWMNELRELPRDKE